ncbi:MAG: AI-2E family transporter [Suipraeoptans sp.]
MELNKENMKRIREIILYIAILVLCIWKYEMLFEVLKYVIGIIFPFIIGSAIAFVLNVPLSFLQKHLFPEKKVENKKMIKKLARPICLIILLLILIAVIVLVVMVVIPQLADSLNQLAVSIGEVVPKAITWAENLFKHNQEALNYIKGLEFNWSKVADWAIGLPDGGISMVLNSTFTVAKNLINGVTTFAIAFIFAIYVLLQKEKLGRQSSKVLYAYTKDKIADKIMSIFSLTYQAFSNFLTGQCLEALILGTMFFITMSVLRFPYALLVALVITVTAMIPIFGAFIGCAIGVFLMLMVNPMQALGFLVLFLVLQQIEGNLIYPHVVGHSVGLPSIWVLVAVTIGANLMGILGMLIFIPIVSVVYTLLRESVSYRLKIKEKGKQ